MRSLIVGFIGLGLLGACSSSDEPKSDGGGGQTGSGGEGATGGASPATGGAGASSGGSGATSGTGATSGAGGTSVGGTATSGGASSGGNAGWDGPLELAAINGDAIGLAATHALLGQYFLHCHET